MGPPNHPAHQRPLVRLAPVGDAEGVDRVGVFRPFQAGQAIRCAEEVAAAACGISG